MCETYFLLLFVANSVRSVRMKPEALMKLAEELPSKFGVEAYRRTISTMRRKGYSWRDIAAFLVEKGVATDHTRVYRMMMEGDPLYDHDDCPLELGGASYESQRGLPLTGFFLGLDVTITAKERTILLEHPERLRSNWCQCQFRISNRPNRVWLKKLHDELHAEFQPEAPHHLVTGRGFELKFSGNLMALDCHTFNLEQCFLEVTDAIVRVNTYFASQSGIWKKTLENIEDRTKKILDLYARSPGDTEDDALGWYADDYKKCAADLQTRFEKLPLN